jgi:hypothetical protein
VPSSHRSHLLSLSLSLTLSLSLFLIWNPSDKLYVGATESKAVTQAWNGMSGYRIHSTNKPWKMGRLRGVGDDDAQSSRASFSQSWKHVKNIFAVKQSVKQRVTTINWQQMNPDRSKPGGVESGTVTQEVSIKLIKSYGKIICSTIINNNNNIIKRKEWPCWIRTL